MPLLLKIHWLFIGIKYFTVSNFCIIYNTSNKYFTVSNSYILYIVINEKKNSEKYTIVRI